MKDYLAELLEPLDILAKKVTRTTANKLVFLIVSGIFFIMVAVAYNIIFRGELPRTSDHVEARTPPESAK